MADIKQITDETVAEAKEQLAKWDAGDIVWTVEMGGMGPGYEQAIQVLTMEIVRAAIDSRPRTDEGWNSVVDHVVHDHDASIGGLSGAQAGAAKQLAYRLLTDGWQAAVDTVRKVDEDRPIMVSNRWPRAATVST